MEKRVFQAHSGLIMQTIKRQAGSLSKAILEGVMNAIDAGAGKCEVVIDFNKVVITDDGKGIAQGDIDTFFNTFGHPHEDGDAKFGYFRIGRGQLFAFGANSWRTRDIGMYVDIARKGLEWDLHKDMPTVVGCSITIELYEKLNHVALASTVNELRGAVKYVTIPVIVNGQQASTDFGKWNHEDDHFWYRFNDNDYELRIYNQGVHVMSKAKHVYGVGGVAVSKRALPLNTARNDVMTSSPEWKAAQEMFRKHGDKPKKTAATEDDRIMAAQAVVMGTATFNDMRPQRIFTDISGRQHAVLDLMPYGGGKICVAEDGDILAEKIHKRGFAFVLSMRTLRRFDVDTIQEMYDVIDAIRDRQWGTWREIVDLDEMKKSVDDRVEIIDPKKYTVGQRLAVRMAEKIVAVAADTIDRHPHLKVKYGDRNWRENIRKVVVGDSEGAMLAWTDGSSYIALDKEFIGEMDRANHLCDIIGISNVVHVVLHEMAHTEGSVETNVHGHDFYELYHDLSGNAAPTIMMACLSNMANWHATENKRAHRNTLRMLDAAEKIERVKSA